jgi:hypothetical protein
MNSAPLIKLVERKGERKKQKECNPGEDQQRTINGDELVTGRGEEEEDGRWWTLITSINWFECRIRKCFSIAVFDLVLTVVRSAGPPLEGRTVEDVILNDERRRRNWIVAIETFGCERETWRQMWLQWRVRKAKDQKSVTSNLHREIKRIR